MWSLACETMSQVMIDDLVIIRALENAEANIAYWDELRAKYAVIREDNTLSVSECWMKAYQKMTEGNKE
jgi:hypothetical protein